MQSGLQLTLNKDTKKYILFCDEMPSLICCFCGNKINSEKDKIYWCPNTQKFFHKSCLVKHHIPEPRMFSFEGIHEDYVISEFKLKQKENQNV